MTFSVIVAADIFDLHTGGGVHLANILPELRKNVDLTCILSKRSSLYQYLRHSGVNVYAPSTPSPFNLLFYLLVLRFTFNKKKLDNVLVHTHTERTSTILNPILYSLRISVVTTIHRSLLHGSPWISNPIKARFFLLVENIILRFFSTKIICISQSILSELSTQRFIEPRKLALIYNCISNPPKSLFCLPNNYSEVKNKFVICSVLRNTHEKGLDYFTSKQFLMLCKSSPLPVKLILIGIPSNSFKLPSEFSRFVDQVQIIPFTQNVHQFMFASNLYIQPSRSEAFCLSVVEATFSHLPLLVNNIPVFHEVLAGYNGAFFCDFFKPCDLVSFNEDLFSKILPPSYFDWDKSFPYAPSFVAQKTFEVYLSLKC